jgi:ATP-dependent DNA helicase RecQ
LDEKVWRTVFRQLIAQGLLAVDHANYGTLKLVDASRAVLKGGRAVHMRQMRSAEPKAAARRPAAPREKQGAGVAAGLDPAAVPLWQRLREWRAAIAKEHGVPAYVVFHDATLAELVRARPQSAAALAQISGVGTRKLERYGAALLDLLRD